MARRCERMGSRFVKTAGNLDPAGLRPRSDAAGLRLQAAQLRIEGREHLKAFDRCQKEAMARDRAADDAEFNQGVDHG